MIKAEIWVNHLTNSLVSVAQPVTDTTTQTAPSLLDNFKQWTGYLAAGVEICAALVIGIAALEAIGSVFLIFVRRHNPPEAKENVRLRLGRWLAVALEFGLAADILRTAVAPTWNEIGQLVVIAFLRTALNYFLQQEIDKATASQSNQPTVSPAESPGEQSRHYEVL